MILVISGLLDESGLSWRKALPRRSAFIVNPRDFSGGGIVIRPNEVGSSRIRSGKNLIKLSDITGVLALTHAFMPEEFLQFGEDTKAYAASEVNALLSYVLHTVGGKKINPPSAMSFNGPLWSYAQWYRFALQQGIPCLPCDESESAGAGSPRETVHEVKCLSGEVLNPDVPCLCDYTSRLQRAAGLNFISATFIRKPDGRYCFGHINTIPDPHDATVRDAVARYLLHG